MVARKALPMTMSTVSTGIPSDRPANTVERGTDQASSADETALAAPFPGRWVAGAIGSLVSAAVALAAFAYQILVDEPGAGLVALICALGIPVAFVVGRELAPKVYAGTMSDALGVGLLFGVMAPPLGALEIFVGPLVVPTAIDPVTIPPYVAFLLIALGFSYIAAVITVPVGLLWAIAVRRLPPDLPARLAVPSPLDRLGVRHAILILIGSILLAQIAGLVAR